MFGILEFLGLATLLQAVDSPTPSGTEHSRSTGQGPESTPPLPTASLTDAPFPSEDALPGSLAWSLLYGPDGNAEALPLLSPEVEAVPLIAGFDAAADQLVVAYDPQSSPGPLLTIEPVADAEGNLVDLVRVDGEAVARVQTASGAPALSPDSIALVPESALDESGTAPA